jgi:spore cortex biosynthesis protein YabQ
MTGQIHIFMACAACGVGVMFAYDWLRILRGHISHAKWVIAVQDVAFWVIVAAVFFLVTLNENYGVVRPALIVGMFAGGGLYHFTLSRLIIKAAHFIINAVKKAILFIFKIISAPFILIYKILRKVLTPFARTSRSFAAKKYKAGRKTLKSFSNYGKMKGKRFKRDLSIMRKKI